MTHKKLLLLSTGLFLLVLSWFTVSKNNSQTKTNSRNSLGVSNSNLTSPSHPLVFFDETTFYAGVGRAEKEGGGFNYHVAGGIIPHHLFPSFIIADFFHCLSHQRSNTIILIGPNHDELGNFKALTSLYGWQTPFGIVDPNESIIKALIENNLVRIDEEALPKDQSVAGIVPFIKYYLPEINIVPILLSGYMTQEEVRILATNLKNHVDKETVVIAAVDFSHYLPSGQAQEKDKTTLEVMRNFDYKQLFSLNNDYLDSPPSVAVLLMLMEELNTTKMDLLHHTNSGELQKDNYIETTSYFSIAYY